MIQEDEEKKIKEILEELNKVLDEITKKKVITKNPEVIENYKQEIEEVKIDEETKQKDKTVLEKKADSITVHIPQNIAKEKIKNEFKESTQKDLEDLSVSKSETVTASILEKQEVQSISQIHILQQDTKIEVKEETIQQVPEEVVQYQIDKYTVTKDVIFVYPKVLPESKDLFFENINSTLSRLSKNRVKLFPHLVIEYDSVEKDIIWNFVNINKIKETKEALFFLIVNESSSESEKLISEISNYVSFIKVITIKELKLKSTYLDIAIDILLTVK